MIEGVIIKPLVKIPDERGCIFPMLRADAEEFKGFGEISFSLLFSGAIQGWNLYKKTIQNIVVLSGMIKLVLYDPRENSKTRGEVQEIFIGDMKYALVQIPCSIWCGCKGITIPHAVYATCATSPHDSSEIIHLDPTTSEIPYRWGVKHG